MKNITPLGTFDFGGEFHLEKDLEVREVFDGARRKIIEIKINKDAVLAKHKAREPITVLCLSGRGVFRAGANLEDEQQLQAGMLITLEAEIEHEAVAEETLHLLVTKFKDS